MRISAAKPPEKLTLKHLQSFPCDVCGRPLSDIGMANILWTYESPGAGEIHRIVHKRCDRDGRYDMLWWQVSVFWNKGKLHPPFGKDGAWFTEAVCDHVREEITL